MEKPPRNVLVPTFGSSSSEEALAVASDFLSRYAGEGIVLNVVEVPEERSLSEGALVARRRRNLLRKIAQSHREQAFRPEVRTAHSLEQGIRTAVAEEDAGLMVLGWNPQGRRAAASTMSSVISNPPCDLAIVKAGPPRRIRKVLVPARGGPHALLALRVAEAVASENDAVLTLLHINLPQQTGDIANELFFEAVRRQVSYAKVNQVEIEAESIELALVSQGVEHDLTVMGAAGRDERSSALLGRIPEVVARQLEGTVVIVKTHEPVTARTFAMVAQRSQLRSQSPISEVVDSWFAENTFHSHEFRNVRHLTELKERHGKPISLVLPTLNEEKTVGRIISKVKRELMERVPLIDELIVVDSDSEDRTVAICEALGVAVHKHPEILPERGSYVGKGEALWKSLQVTKGDIIVWVDSDITGFHPKFVYGLLGPLLTQPRLGFVKGFYRRPLNLGGELLTTGGGRVTELTARPLINLFYPQLSGLVQPLAGEMAGRREVLEALPFFTGYGVETGLLIDILEQFGLSSMAQVDLEYRVHRNQSLLSLSKMAFAIVQVVIKRLSDREKLQLMQDVSTSMKLIHYSPTELFLEVKEIREHERAPINTLPEYANRESPRFSLTASAAT